MPSIKGNISVCGHEQVEQNFFKGLSQFYLENCFSAKKNRVVEYFPVDRTTVLMILKQLHEKYMK